MDEINKKILNSKGNVNAPTMGYYTVYGKYPNFYIRGRTSNPKKLWNGLNVDSNLKDEWLDKLNNLPLEIKSTDEGKDKTRVALVIFRMPKDKDNLYKKMVENLKKETDIFVSSDLGYENRPRICVAKAITPRDKTWEKWWSKLPAKLKRAYKKTIS